MRPVIDLYLNPPADGPVVCADEKTCIQALQRRFPDLSPSRPGQLRRRSVEYVRHGTRCLTAGLFVHTGKILGLVTPTRPKEVFLDFLNLLDARNGSRSSSGVPSARRPATHASQHEAELAVALDDCCAQP